MATCAVMGQAAGTAAAHCVKPRRDPPGSWPTTPPGWLRTPAGPAPRRPDHQGTSATRTPLDVARAGQGRPPRRSIRPRRSPRTSWTASSATCPGGDGAPLDGADECQASPAWLDLAWDKPQKDPPRPDHLRHRLPPRADAHLVGLATTSTSSAPRSPRPSATTPSRPRSPTAGRSSWPGSPTTTSASRRHAFEAVEARSIRLEVLATNGSDQARVYEVRCYA